MNKGKTAVKRAQWMAEYERQLVEVRPELQGKVDWDTATYFFNTGISAAIAVETYLQNHPLN